MKVTLDAKQAMATYRVGLGRLQQLPGFSQRQILRAEAGVILKTWAGRTSIATQADARKRARLRAARRVGVTRAGTYNITVNTGIRGQRAGIVWFRTKRGKWQYAGDVSDKGKFTPTWLHYRPKDWADIKEGAERYAETLREMMPLALKSVGLARQSVIQIADQLRIDLSQVRGGGRLSDSQIQKARMAIASTGKTYQNGTGSEAGGDVQYHVDLINRFPRNLKMGMDRTLAVILMNRGKFITSAYRKGAFDSMQNSAKSFPNLFVTSGMNAVTPIAIAQ